MQFGKHKKEENQGFKLPNNNSMELLAAIRSLELLTKEGCDVLIYSDSKYVVQAVEKGWVFGWVKKNFKGKKNPDLSKRFLVAYERHNVKFQWVKGHAGNEMNERADFLATSALHLEPILIDQGYEDSIKGDEELF